MRKTIPLALAAAALIATTSLSSAQTAMEYEYFVRGERDQMSIVDRETGTEKPLLTAEGDARPAGCAEGDFYILGENTIVSCDDEAMMFDMMEPSDDMTMDDGSKFDQSARILQPHQNPSGSTQGGGASTGSGSGG